MDQKEIGKFIAACRKEKKLTQTQLAEQLGVSDKSISRWETGRTMPDLSLYEPLCAALGIQISELLYAGKMTEQEKRERGEQAALRLFQTKKLLRLFGILTDVLILVGIVMTLTLTKVLAVTAAQMALTLVCGSFVWGFGLVLKVQIQKALLAAGKNNEA